MNETTKQRVEAIMPLLPTSAPDGIIEKAVNDRLISGEALVFTMEWRPGENGKKERAVRLMCSACGGNSICEYVKLDGEDTGRTCGYSYNYYGPYGFRLYDKQVYRHKSICVCPLCGYGGTVYLASKINYGTKIDSTRMLSVHNFDGVLGLLGWYIAKYIGKDGKTFISADGMDGVLVLDRTMVRVRKYELFFHYERLLQKWEYRKTFQFDITEIAKDCYFGLTRKLVEQTTADKSGLIDYVKNGGKYPVKFLRTWQKYRQLENLAVQGYSKILDGVMNSYYYTISQMGQKFNLKEKSPDKILGISKLERAAVRSCDLREFEYYKRFRDEHRVTLTKDQLIEARKCGLNVMEDLISTKRYGKVSLSKVLNYITKQKQDAIYLRDYWDMCVTLYAKIPSEIRWPKNVKAAHDDLSRQIRWKEEQELASGFEAQEKSFAPYAFTDENTGLFIRVCHDQQEMINEGKILVHCVARYAKSHSKGDTCIMLIRKIDKPDDPYFTLEYKEGKVVQNRGYKNCVRTPEVKAFEEKWLAYIKTIKQKGKKNAKRVSDEECIRAGA